MVMNVLVLALLGYLVVGLYITLLVEIATSRIGVRLTLWGMISLLVFWPGYLWTIIASPIDDAEQRQLKEHLEEEDRR